jgi:hypothetical protein
MKHSVVHDLGRAQAKRVAESAWNSYSTRYAHYSPSCKWVNDYKANIGFVIKGVKLEGSIDVKDKDIELDLDVPFYLRPFKGQAMKVIEDEIRMWIDKSKSGEL